MSSTATLRILTSNSYSIYLTAADLYVYLQTNDLGSLNFTQVFN